MHLRNNSYNNGRKGKNMESKDLTKVICSMVKQLHNKESLWRIYNVVSRLLKKEAVE